jgi:hypothetical protein
MHLQEASTLVDGDEDFIALATTSRYSIAQIAVQ